MSRRDTRSITFSLFKEVPRTLSILGWRGVFSGLGTPDNQTMKYTVLSETFAPILCSLKSSQELSSLKSCQSLYFTNWSFLPPSPGDRFLTGDLRPCMFTYLIEHLKDLSLYRDRCGTKIWWLWRQPEDALAFRYFNTAKLDALNVIKKCRRYHLIMSHFDRTRQSIDRRNGEM